MMHISAKNSVAIFQIHRLPEKGYSIIDSSGELASELNNDALNLLNYIKQPDAYQAGVSFSWHGPIGPKEYYVGVTTKLDSKGDTEFTQTWFLSEKESGFLKGFIKLVFSIIFGIVIGAGISIGGVIPNAFDSLGIKIPVAKKENENIQSEAQPNNESIVKTNDTKNTAANADPIPKPDSDEKKILEKIKEFLSEEGVIINTKSSSKGELAITLNSIKAKSLEEISNFEAEYLLKYINKILSSESISDQSSKSSKPQ